MGDPSRDHCPRHHSAQKHSQILHLVQMAKLQSESTEKVGLLLQGDEFLPQVDKFNDLRVMFMSDGVGDRSTVWCLLKTMFSL